VVSGVRRINEVNGLMSAQLSRCVAAYSGISSRHASTPRCRRRVYFGPFRNNPENNGVDEIVTRPAKLSGPTAVCLKVEIHEIHLICEIRLPKYRNPRHAYEIHCLKIEIHEIFVQTSNAKNRNPLLFLLSFSAVYISAVKITRIFFVYRPGSYKSAFHFLRRLST